MACVCAFQSCSCSAEQQPAMFLSFPTSFEVVKHCLIFYMLCKQNVFSSAHVMKAHWLLVRAARRSRTDLQAFTSRALHVQKLQLLTSHRDAFGYIKRRSWRTFTSFSKVVTHIEIFMCVPQNAFCMQSCRLWRKEDMDNYCVFTILEKRVVLRLGFAGMACLRGSVNKKLTTS